MKLEFWTIGKKHESHYILAIEEFEKRLKHYVSFEWKIIPASNYANHKKIKEEECEKILSKITNQDFVILFDEKGKNISSTDYAQMFDNQLTRATKKIILIIGGAFGVNEDLFQRADQVISFSKMVFPHQLVRLMVMEQTYRAFTILKGENYHHQ